MAQRDETIVETLRQENRKFRTLELRHQQLTEDLDQLVRHRSLTPDEEIQKRQIQKYKLAMKDGMNQIIRAYGHDRGAPGSAHPHRSMPHAEGA